MASVSVKTVGNWKGAEKILGELVSTVPQAAVIIRQEAEASKNRLQENLRGGKIDFAALSSRTHKDNPEKPILIDTEEYVSAIKVLGRNPMSVGVGIGPTAKNRDGTSLAKIGLYHEYGTGRMPPRPHWRKEYTVYKRSLSTKLSLLLGSKVSLAGRR